MSGEGAYYLVRDLNEVFVLGPVAFILLNHNFGAHNQIHLGCIIWMNDKFYILYNDVYLVKGKTDILETIR